jgi:hypothetical protein
MTYVDLEHSGIPDTMCWSYSFLMIVVIDKFGMHHNEILQYNSHHDNRCIFYTFTYRLYNLILFQQLPLLL